MTTQRETFPLDDDLKPIRIRRQANLGMLRSDKLPTLTPIIGDVVVYESWSGDKMHHTTALVALREGSSVYYRTYEIAGGPTTRRHAASRAS